MAPLIKHYGIVHKSVQKFIRGQIAGRYVHHDPKAMLNKPSIPDQYPPTPQQQHHPAGMSPADNQSPLVNGIQSMHEPTLQHQTMVAASPNMQQQQMAILPPQQQNVQTQISTPDFWASKDSRVHTINV